MNMDKNLFYNQRRIGLTGGIASGKSTIANYLEKTKKVIVLDADNYSKEFLKHGSKSYEKIINHYGTQIIDKNSFKKEIKTNALREIIFNDERERNWLENLIHPLIRKRMIDECNNYRENKILLLVIPLLFEAKFNDLCTEIWLVKCSKELQKKRLIQRDNISEKDANKIINIQQNHIQKEKNSNVIINNEGDVTIWKEKIDQLI